MDIIQLLQHENSKAASIFSVDKWREFMNVQFYTLKAIAMS